MTDDDTTGTAPDPASSILGSLRARRTAIIQSELLTLPVPRWSDPEIYCRFHPLDHGEIRAQQTRVEKAPKAKRFQVEVDANADLLIKGVESVFARLDGGDEKLSLRPNDPHGEPTTFDPDLAEALGLEEGATARAVVKALFITEGDILSTATELVRWSGYTLAEADSRTEGE